MTEYRIVEAYRKIWIEKKLMGDTWIRVDIKDVPKYHDTVVDARSWVATIKRGVVYHDAEDAPNLAQDECKADDDTSDGIKPLEWFEERIERTISAKNCRIKFKIHNKEQALSVFNSQRQFGHHFLDVEQSPQ